MAGVATAPRAASPEALQPALERSSAASGRARIGLVWTLIRTDFKARYHGTLGGFAWALAKPIAMFAVLMGVFSFLFSDPAYKLNLIVGLFLWDFFAEGTKTGLASLHARGFLLTKARCPTWILVVTSISNAAITLAVFYAIIVVFLTVAGRPPSASALALFVAYGGALVAMVIGFSLAASVLFLRYRDLNQVWDVAAHAGFFLAPIVYPLGVVPERFHFYFYLWPPTPVIEFSRAVLVRGTVPTATGHLYLAIDAAVILLTGLAIFRRFAPRAAEYV
jgi:lipopolysaccharide transport system permease protein